MWVFRGWFSLLCGYFPVRRHVAEVEKRLIVALIDRILNLFVKLTARFV
jgi:hypothetical protein